MKIKYLLAFPNRLRHRRGFGVQSPWAYEFVRDVLEEKSLYYAYDDMSVVISSLKLKVKPSIRRRYEMLFRISNKMKPSYILQAGFSEALGICYMSLPSHRTPCVAVNTSFSDVSKGLFKHFKIESFEGNVVEICKQTIEQRGKIGILSFPLKNEYKALYEYAISNVDSNSLFILDDISSNEGRVLWNEVLDDSRTTVTFELDTVGLVFFDKRRSKQNFTL